MPIEVVAEIGLLRLLDPILLLDLVIPLFGLILRLLAGLPPLAQLFLGLPLEEPLLYPLLDLHSPLDHRSHLR